jgi:hypothetical protein
LNPTNKTEHCLNCGSHLNGANYCPSCGQKNDNSKLTLKHVLSESISNLFAFDGRFFYTLRNLILRPGKVPKEYVEGKRMRFMNPVRIYFLTSVLLLGIVQIKDGSINVVNIQRPDKQEGNIQADSTRITKEDIAAPIDAGFSNDEAPGILREVYLMSNFYGNHKGLSVKSALDSMGYEYSFYNRFKYSQGAKIAEFDNDEFNQFLFSKMFWVLFLFLPLLALILKLLYARRSFFYPEHLFFTFYNQSVFFILLSIANLFSGITEVVLMVVFLISFAVYLYIAMRRFYEQSARKTLAKFILLNLILIPVFAAFFALSAFVALLFY